ncbi:MAG: cell division FtsZ family protein [Kiritimatiellales bacterium]|nr:cell division FtsZ family protein [Kiritimatiellales bacterium]MCF7864838.1 cell division FtsZ family protein [Kiritimatiellales bacterium]
MNDATTTHGRIIAAPRILVMGIGSSGTQAVAHMCSLNPGLDAVVIDTDTKVLEATTGVRVIQVGGAVTNGFSAGGDVELGRQSIEKDSSNIRQQLRQVDLLVIVAGLGGGTGSGAVPVITRIAREAGTLVLCMATLPFVFEGKPIIRKAEDALKKIRTHADAIIRIPNESMVDRADADLPVEQIFARSQQLMMDGINALWRMLSQNGLCGLDFSCIRTMLRNCDGFCHFASADAAGETRGAAVADGLVQHRLLNSGKILAKAAGLVVGLTGGHDLKLSEIETVMNRLQEKLPADTWVNFGVAIDPAFAGRLSAIVLVAEQWKEPLVDDANRQMGFTFNRRLSVEQGQLPLETTGKGRFANLNPTIHENQDLDVPTYIRRDIKLPR